tara:strand:+ start:8814 stop:9440 length:627 start_codon:yes stop_codon:yes gene_type:complete
MTAPTTYAELQTEIASYLARDDLTAKIPNFIKYAEVKMNNDLRIREMISTGSITTSTSDKFVALPTDFLELISFNDDLGEPLQALDYEKLQKYQYASSAGRPEYFTISNRIDFERVDGTSRVFPMRFYKRLNLIADATNDVLTNYVQLYLYGSMLQAAPYIRDKEQLQNWKLFYEEAVTESNHRAIIHDRKLRTEISTNGTFNILRGS